MLGNYILVFGGYYKDESLLDWVINWNLLVLEFDELICWLVVVFLEDIWSLIDCFNLMFGVCYDYDELY